MSVTAAAFPPISFTAGDTVTWEMSISDYDAADGWAVSFYLRGATRYDLPAAVSSGTTHTVTVPAATSANYTAGDYWLFGYAVNSGTGERVQIYSGQCEVFENHATATAVYDGRSHAKKTLDAIESAIEGRATREESGYSINAGGVMRQIQFCDIGQLIAARSYYQSLVRQEEDAARVAAGKKPRNKILTRFVT